MNRVLGLLSMTVNLLKINFNQQYITKVLCGILNV